MRRHRWSCPPWSHTGLYLGCKEGSGRERIKQHISSAGAPPQGFAAAQSRAALTRGVLQDLFLDG